jgi:hypothetical protein
MKLARGALLLCCAALSCAKGPRLPTELTFEGVRLEKGRVWSKEGESSVGFLPPGETLATASLFVFVVVAEQSSGAALHALMMDRSRNSPAQQWHERTTSDEACTVGLPPVLSGSAPRPFVELQVCRSISRGAACVGAQEKLSDEVVGRCLSGGWSCWDELCTQKWAARRTALEAVLKATGAR